MKPNRRLRQARPVHTDDWLMTYADTITLLLCLFIVVLALRQSGTGGLPKPGFHPAVAASISAPHKPDDSMVFRAFVRTDQPAEDANDEPMTGSTAAAAPTQHVLSQPPSQASVPAPSQASAEVIDLAALPVVPLMADRPALQVPSPTAIAAPRFPELVHRLQSQGEAASEQKGDRITTLEIGSTAFFTSGSATLSNSGRVILQDVAVRLKSNEWQEYQITVEGHTDDTPISTAQFPSNWELSTARAAAVVHYFLEQGVAAQKLRAAGYADTFPLAPNRSAEGTAIPLNQARNRRVVIKLEKIDQENRDPQRLSSLN